MKIGDLVRCSVGGHIGIYLGIEDWKQTDPPARCWWYKPRFGHPRNGHTALENLEVLCK